MCLKNKNGIISNLTDDEQDLFNTLIMSGVDRYLFEMDRICKEHNDVDTFMLILEDLEGLLSKLDFEMTIKVKEIKNEM